MNSHINKYQIKKGEINSIKEKAKITELKNNLEND